MKFLKGAVALAMGLLAPSAVMALPPITPVPKDYGKSSSDLLVRDDHELAPRAPPTCNTPSNRACWTTSPSFNINTDYEVSVPTTGATRKVRLLEVNRGL